MKPAEPKFLKHLCIGFDVIFVLVFVVVVAMYRFVTKRELITYIDQLKPGMIYTEVIQLIPPQMVHTDREPCTSMSWNVALARSNASPAYQIYCHGPLDPLLGIEVGNIYFDQKDQLIGISYSSSGVGPGDYWKPKWVAQE